MVALMASGLIGVLTHVPAGLGVLEAVFLKLGPAGKETGILVALLCYRAVYYLVPLALAAPLYAGLEFRFSRRRVAGNRAPLVIFPGERP